MKKVPYNIKLVNTTRPWIAKVAVDFKDGKGKVVPAIGTSADAQTLTGPNSLDFTVVRIHHGSSDTSTEGCLIVSNTRNKDGTLVTDEEKGIEITKLVKSENITQIYYVNDWKTGFEYDTSPAISFIPARINILN